MLKYFCPRCLETCEYMCVRTINTIETPINTIGKRVNPDINTSSIISGSICFLCHEELPLEPSKYFVHVFEHDGVEYIDSNDIFEIRKNEKSYYEL